MGREREPWRAPSRCSFWFTCFDKIHRQFRHHFRVGARMAEQSLKAPPPTRRSTLGGTNMFSHNPGSSAHAEIDPQ